MSYSCRGMRGPCSCIRMRGRVLFERGTRCPPDRPGQPSPPSCPPGSRGQCGRRRANKPSPLGTVKLIAAGSGLQFDKMLLSLPGLSAQFVSMLPPISRLLEEVEAAVRAGQRQLAAWDGLHNMMPTARSRCYAVRRLLTSGTLSGPDGVLMEEGPKCLWTIPPSSR